MKQYIRQILTAGMALAALSASAQEPHEQTLAEWAAEQSEVLPEVVNGVKMYRPEVAGSSLIITDMAEVLPTERARQVFLKALMFAREKMDPATERIEAVDFKNNRFTVIAEKVKPGGDASETYSYTEAFQGADGLLSFSCGDIAVDYKERGILPRKLSFEKLKPQVNERHRAWIEAQAFLFSDRIRDIVSYINGHADMQVTHEDNILRGEVVQGMNPDEVILTLGTPFSRKKSGGRDKWLFDSGTSIIFTDGVVSHIMY